MLLQPSSNDSNEVELTLNVNEFMSVIQCYTCAPKMDNGVEVWNNLLPKRSNFSKGKSDAYVRKQLLITKTRPPKMGSPMLSERC